MGSWEGVGALVSMAVLLASFLRGVEASAWCCALGLLLLLLAFRCAWWGLDVRSMRSGCVWNGCGFMDMARCRSGSDIVAVVTRFRTLMWKGADGH